MALPSSGSLSLSQVNTEMGRASNTLITLGSSAIRDLFGVASGAISHSHGRGKAYFAKYLVEFLIVGGGGSGGTYYNGTGGGAGGYISASATMTDSSDFIITVGAGGANCTSNGDGYGNAGSASSIVGSAINKTAFGGAAQNRTGTFGSASGLSNLYTQEQGNAGGSAHFTCCWNHTNGGGGGAGGSGSGINGGAGLTWFDGITRAGGGGGGVYPEYVGPGQGSAGGGNGGYRDGSSPTAAIANSGSGGGGSSHSTGSTAGGSGIVIVRYAGSQRGTGGTVTSSGGYTYHKFTSSGVFRS